MSDRIGAILGMDDKEKIITLLGYGVVESEGIPTAEAVGIMSETARQTKVKSKKLKLDSGETVWGTECWWGNEDKVKERIARAETEGYKIITTTVEELRSKFKETDAQEIATAAADALAAKTGADKENADVRSKTGVCAFVRARMNRITEEMSKLAPDSPDHLKLQGQMILLEELSKLTESKRRKISVMIEEMKPDGGAASPAVAAIGIECWPPATNEEFDQRIETWIEKREGPVPILEMIASRTMQFIASEIQNIGKLLGAVGSSGGGEILPSGGGRGMQPAVGGDDDADATLESLAEDVKQAGGFSGSTCEKCGMNYAEGETHTCEP